MELPKDEPLSVIQWVRSKERLYLVDCTTFDYSNFDVLSTLPVFEQLHNLQKYEKFLYRV